MYYVYALTNRENKIYVGMTEDLARRVKEHNSGQTKTTKHYKPWFLFYSEQFPDRLAARSREKKLKSGVGREFLRIFLVTAPIAQLDRATAF